MTREDVKKMLGETATDEMITAILNAHNTEIANERGKAKKYQDEAASIPDLKKQIEELSGQNLSDIEKANKERDNALEAVAKVTKQMESMEMKAKFAEKGIVGEDADKLLESLSNGKFDVETLGQIITARETTAAANKEKELMASTPNPKGGKGGADPDEKTDAEKLASEIGKTLSGSNKAADDIVANYI